MLSRSKCPRCTKTDLRLRLKITRIFFVYKFHFVCRFRIGLSRFENLDRMSVVYDIFNEILQGIKIKIDPDGSIWAKRMCSCPVYLKPLYITRQADLFDIDKRPVKVITLISKKVFPQ